MGYIPNKQKEREWFRTDRVPGGSNIWIMKWSKVKQSEVAQSCSTLCDPVDCSLPGSSIHGILQARILEWVAISFSRDLPNSRIEPGSPALQADALPYEPPWDECNCVVVWVFFGIAFLGDWNKNWPFPVLWPLLSFPNLLAYWVQHFHSSIF